MAPRARNAEIGRESRARPADHRSVRRHNMGLVVANVAAGGPRSRARISAETGLNPSTVSSLIGDLIDSGLLREAGIEQDGTVGRPGRSLELNPEGGAAIGIEIGDDGVGVLALDLAGNPRYRAFFSQSNEEASAENVIEQLVRLTAEAMACFKNPDIPVVCTIALPGLIGGASQLLEAPNINWHEVPIGKLWRRRMPDLPMVMENEARLAAYAEMTAGAAQDLSSFVFISGGTGLGSGLVIDRQLFRGAHGFAGEFGHVTIDRSARGSAWGGPGTVQTLAGERALATLAGLAEPYGIEPNDPDRIGRHVAALAAKGDERALAALNEVGHALGVGIAVVSNLFDMEAIVLGGYLSYVEAWLRGPIEAELDVRVISRRWAPAAIRFSAMGREAAVRGAARWSLNAILKQAGGQEISDAAELFSGRDKLSSSGII